MLTQPTDRLKSLELVQQLKDRIVQLIYYVIRIKLNEVRKEGIQNNSHLRDLVYLSAMKFNFREVVRHHHNVIPHRNPPLHSSSCVLAYNLYTCLLVFCQNITYRESSISTAVSCASNFARNISDMVASI